MSDVFKAEANFYNKFAALIFIAASCSINGYNNDSSIDLAVFMKSLFMNNRMMFTALNSRVL